MSYLVLPKGIPDFSRVVISLWFRAPKEAVERVAAGDNPGISAGPAGFFMLQKILPLITFGKPQQNKNYVADPPVDVAVDVSGTHPDAIFMASQGYTSQGAYDVDPCLIGLFCYGEGFGSSFGKFSLAFNIQTGVEMVTSSTSYVITRVEYYDNTKPPPYSGPLGEGGWATPHQHYSIADASYADNNQPQFFNVVGIENFTSDEWHHVLVSFDISGAVSIGQPFASSECRLWYAIDDKDYRGQEHMGIYRGSSSGGGSNVDNLGDNTIVTDTAWRWSSPIPEGGFHFGNYSVPPPSGSYSGAPGIPTNEQPIGIPAAVKYVDGIYHVEMAEFQMWTGLTLDTEVETNRRAFIDYARDADGNKVKDKDGKDVMKPVDPEKAAKLLGKKPEILLHGSGKWIKGENTGTTGMNYSTDPPTKIPGGQFDPTGEIKSYKPDPSLAKDST